MKRQQKELIALAVLTLAAAAVWYYASRPPAVATSAGSANADYALLAVDNPQLHWWKIAEARKTEYKWNGRDPSSTIAPPPPDVPKGPGQSGKKGPGPMPPPVPPPPPILPVKFFGYGTVPNGTPRRAFFTDQDEVYIAAEGEMILGRFRILRIGNDSVEFEEVNTGLRNTTPIEAQGQPSS